MKKLLLPALGLFIGTAGFSQETNVLNGDMEGWNTSTINTLDTLVNSIGERTKFGTVDSIDISRSGDAAFGNWSVLMESKVDEKGDTITGYFINGTWDDNGPGGGDPFTLAADTIRGWIKHDIMPGDTAWLVVQLKSAGTAIAGGQYPFTGTQGNWTEFALATNYWLGAVDTIFVAATASNIVSDDGVAIPGSWIMFDDIHLTKNTGGEASFANADFENWTDNDFNEIINWNTIDYTASRSTNANSGTYATQLEVKRYGNDNSIIGGILTNYDYDSNNNAGGTPYVLTPGSIEFYADIEVGANDTGSVFIEFFNSGSSVGQSAVQLVGTNGGYMKYATNITLSQTPDTFKISVHAGDSVGSKVLIDDINLSMLTVSTDEITNSSSKLFPNPSIGFVTVSTEAASFVLYDILGKELNSDLIGSNKIIDIQNLNEGVYFIALKNAEGKTLSTERLIKK